MGTTAQKLQAILDSKADIKDAIEQKGVEVGSTPLSGYAQKILDIPSGDPDDDFAPLDDVRFIDYDESIIFSYTKAQFLALSAMPTNTAVHEGLVSDGWTHTLTEAQNYVTKYGVLDIGALYDTTNGGTVIKMQVDAGETIPVYMKVQNLTNVTVNWGDGNTISYNRSSGYSNFVEHTYTNDGIYTISIYDIQGTSTSGLGSGHTLVGYVTIDYSKASHLANKVVSIHYGSSYSNNLCWLKGLRLKEHTGFQYLSATGEGSVCSSLKVGVMTAYTYQAFVSCENMRHVVFKENMAAISTQPLQRCYKIDRICVPSGQTSVVSYFAQYCYSAKNIIIPEGVTTIGTVCFFGCFNVKEIIIPAGVTSIGDQAFRGCVSAQRIILPEGLITIGMWAFEGCMNITTLTIPSTVTSIGNLAFKDNGGSSKLFDIHVKATTPPTITVHSFYTPTKIYVPTGTLSAYQSASNWSSFANIMEEETT